MRFLFDVTLEKGWGDKAEGKVRLFVVAKTWAGVLKQLQKSDVEPVEIKRLGEVEIEDGAD